MIVINHQIEITPYFQAAKMPAPSPSKINLPDRQQYDSSGPFSPLEEVRKWLDMHASKGELTMSTVYFQRQRYRVPARFGGKLECSNVYAIQLHLLSSVVGRLRSTECP